jgi:hypothetical protein
MPAAIALFLFGAVTAVLSLELRLGTLRAPDSGFFPFGLGVLLMALAAGHAVRLRMAAPTTEAPAAPAAAGGGSTRRVLTFMGAGAAATALLEPLGYAIVSFLLMVALLWTLGVRRWAVCGLIALASAAASWLVFVQWLEIPLPRGWVWL